MRFRFRLLPGPSWACLLAAVLIAGCSREPASTDPAASDTPASAIARSDARLQLVNNNGRIRYDGTVDSEATRTALIDTLAAAYGADRIGGELRVEPTTRAPGWLDAIGPLLAGFDLPGSALGFDGDRIALSGQVTDVERARLLELARQQFPDATLEGLFEGAVRDADTPLDADAQALEALAPDASAQSVVDALNMMDVAFEPDSAQVSPASLDIISRAGRAIADLPPETRVRIVGESRPLGDADEARRRAQQRAEAVKVQLIINGSSPARLDTRAATGAGADRVTFEVAD